jgi:hypothetical protein
MTTLAPSMLRAAMAKWEDQYASAVFAGIVGDAAHRLNGGYHISIEDQPSGNYSVTRPKDKAPPGKWRRDLASAGDMSKNTKDMIEGYKYWNALFNDRTDPRRKYFNAVNCWDGTGDAVRLDFVANTRSFATPDHRSHEHAELCRMYAEDPEAGRALVSVVSGDTKEQWNGGDEVAYPKYGDHNQQVNRLQYDLDDLGCYTGPKDGIYGPAVQAAVKKYRAKHLPSDKVGDGKEVSGWQVHQMARDINVLDAGKGPKGDKGDKGDAGKDGLGAGSTFTMTGTGKVD